MCWGSFYIDAVSNYRYNSEGHTSKWNDHAHHKIEQNQQKELPIIEPHAVIDPRAVVVHI